VSFPFVGDATAPSRIAHALDAATDEQPVGRVVRGEGSGARGRSLGGGWSERVAPHADQPAAGGQSSTWRRPSVAGRKRNDIGGGDDGRDAGDGGAAAPATPRDAAPAGIEDGGDDAGAPDPAVQGKTSRRSSRSKPTPSLAQQIEDAVIPCLQRAAGLPSSSAMGSHLARATATIVGQQGGRSRAIVLRYGTRRDQSAILWVSPRGGLLCSCFEGTQNASFLSVSSRSTDCVHTRVVNKCLSLGRVPVDKLRKRMGLRKDAADFAVPRVFDGTLVMYVLYQRVYSIVTFTTQSAICVAPGCRSFARRCGHVRIARRVREELKLQDVGRVEIDVKAKAGGKAPSRFLSNEEEDDGLEKQPSDTIRADGDSPEENLCERARRNLLPCAGEEAQADAWARTADWQGIIEKQKAQGGGASTLDKMEVLCATGMLNGMIENVSKTLVEPRCGSCGAHREERHHVAVEPAILYHHHPSAPKLQVCALLSALH